MDSRTMITIEGRKGGKSARYGLSTERAERIRREVLPMSNERRLANYLRQNGSTRKLTGPQMRRLARHGEEPYTDRQYNRRPIRQHFSDRIDNQRKPTGRVGMARFGPAQGIEGLQKLLFSPRTSEKGMDLDSNRAASVAGRMMARTASGRRRLRRHSSRGR